MAKVMMDAWFQWVPDETYENGSIMSKGVENFIWEIINYQTVELKNKTQRLEYLERLMVNLIPLLIRSRAIDFDESVEVLFGIPADDIKNFFI